MHDLIDKQEPGWPLVEEWLRAAKNHVEVLPADPRRAGEVLTLVQVTTRSPMGAIAYHSGGLLIDSWLRVLGGGGSRMNGDLARWNGLGDSRLFAGIKGAFIVAIDVLGGVFALASNTRQVSYFAPDALAWQELGIGYSQFVASMLQSNLDEFFAGLRWPAWREEVTSIDLDSGIQFFPPLWTKESKTGPTQRHVVPLRELVAFAFDTAVQLGT